MDKNIAKNKTIDFAVRIVKLCNYLKDEKHEFTLSQQLLKSGTSIGANFRESQNAASRKGFINKIAIALKESNETEYWLELLYKTNYLTRSEFESINMDCDEIVRLLTAIVKTAKGCDNG